MKRNVALSATRAQVRQHRDHSSPLKCASKSSRIDSERSNAELVATTMNTCFAIYLGRRLIAMTISSVSTLTRVTRIRRSITISL